MHTHTHAQTRPPPTLFPGIATGFPATASLLLATYGNHAEPPCPRSRNPGVCATDRPMPYQKPHQSLRRWWEYSHSQCRNPSQTFCRAKHIRSSHAARCWGKHGQGSHPIQRKIRAGSLVKSDELKPCFTQLFSVTASSKLCQRAISPGQAHSVAFPCAGTHLNLDHMQDGRKNLPVHHCRRPARTHPHTYSWAVPRW